MQHGSFPGFVSSLEMNKYTYQQHLRFPARELLQRHHQFCGRDEILGFFICCQITIVS